MKNYFIPDAIHKSIYDIPPDFFMKHRIKAIVCDIDNTLIPYEKEEPDEKIRIWLKGISDMGIGIALASNNRKKRVDRFNRELGCFSVSNAGKPSRRAIRRAMAHFCVEAREICLIGDQIFTDVLAAKRAGCHAVLVEPICDKADVFTKMKRFMEKPFKSKFYKNKSN